MGRSSKLTFPVPGRRSKQRETSPIVSAPMSKAQRLLGAADLNINGTAQWDEMSNSGISISISESTASRGATEPDPRNGKQGDWRESSAARQARGNGARWEMESETVPVHLHPNRMSKRPNGGEAAMADQMSDASDLRRQQSNSTLRSWYDKSKMPLHISQQTSASAMAKGLPAKAGMLLDVDAAGARQSWAPQQHKPKRRPGRLDLSHLIPGRSHREQVSEAPRGSKIGQDLVTSPTSDSAISPKTKVPSPSFQPARKLVKKPTKERLAEMAAMQNQPRPRQGSHQSLGSSLNSPQDLYEHYEQASFRNVFESPVWSEAQQDIPEEDEHQSVDEVDAQTSLTTTSGIEIPDFPPIPAGPTPLRSPSHNRTDANMPNPVIREPHVLNNGTYYAQNELKGRAGSLATMGSGHRHQPHRNHGTCDNDYASSVASVSSRHTKTSRASKHTNQSLADSDRQERSVLSLSSDSEEDDSYADTASRSAQSVSSLGQSHKESPASPAASARKPARARGESHSDRRSSKRASFAPSATYLTIPHESPPTLKPTTYTPRKSSITKTNPQPSQFPQPPRNRRSSRVSTGSASTTASAIDWQNQLGYGVQEAKAVTVRSVASTSQSIASEPRKASDAQSSTQKRSIKSNGEQLTPPLSPSSVDFCLESDQSTDESGKTTHNPRFMAVTRQEQVLLAALRSKRAMMRDGIPTVRVDEDSGPAEMLETQPQRRGQGHQHTSSQATIRGSSSPDAASHPARSLRHKGSATSNGTITLDSQSSGRRRDSSVGSNMSSQGLRPSSRITNEPRSLSRFSSALGSKSSGGSRKTSSRSSSSMQRPALSGEPEPAIQEDGQDEQVLVYLNRPRKNVTSMDHAEPSPDLSDFLSFDNLSDEGTQEPTEEHGVHGQHGKRRQEATDSSSWTRSTSRTSNPSARQSTQSSRPRTSSTRQSRSSVQHHERHGMPSAEPKVAEDGIDIPRPDSPISNGTTLLPTLPEMARKKAVRLSAVGSAGPEIGCWGDDG